jgi:hypothetical protein
MNEDGTQVIEDTTIMHGWSSGGMDLSYQYAAPLDRGGGNPNPERYKIDKCIQMDDLIIVRIKYNDARDFEGYRVLVLENVTIEDLMNASGIDPHFAEDEYAAFSPIASFKPDEHGIERAKAFCKGWRVSKNLLGHR